MKFSYGSQLFFISDRNQGWWNIFRTHIRDLHSSSSAATYALVIHPVVLCVGREFGSASWVFGHKSYDFLPSGELFTTYADCNGRMCGIICNAAGTHEIDIKNSFATENFRHSQLTIAPIPSHLGPFASATAAISSIDSLAIDCQGNVYFIGGGPSVSNGIFRWNCCQHGGDTSVRAPFTRPTPESRITMDMPIDWIDTHVGPVTILRSSVNLRIDQDYISYPKFITFPTVCNGESCEAYGMYYPAHNPRFTCSAASARPPLLVKLHGGPTGKAVTTCRLDIQFFTSRGIAVLDVDYGGSTGYGRDYRKRMADNWGVVDVEDCCRGALFLADQGLVDRNKLAIQGGSAGGYTALATIAFRDVFRAATSSYGNN